MPAWSPDGQTIAYVADVDSTLQVFTRQRTAAVSAQITQAPYDCRHPFWSLDGKRLYFISLARERESLWSVSAAGGTPQVVIENVTRAAVSPDGNTIAFLRDEQPADIVGAATLWFWTERRSGNIRGLAGAISTRLRSHFLATDGCSH
jgi:tricorn protease